MTVWRAASASTTGDHVSAVLAMPCSRTSSGAIAGAMEAHAVAVERDLLRGDRAHLRPSTLPVATSGSLHILNAIQPRRDRHRRAGLARGGLAGRQRQRDERAHADHRGADPQRRA